MFVPGLGSLVAGVPGVGAGVRVRSGSRPCLVLRRYIPPGDIPQPEPPEEVARIFHKKKKELKKIKCYPISIDILPSPC